MARKAKKTEQEQQEMNEQQAANIEQQEEQNITPIEQEAPAPVIDEQQEEQTEGQQPETPIAQPTIRHLIHAFENAFSIANAHFYGDCLESPVITIQQGAKARAYGWVSVAKVWHEEKGGEFRELNISAEYLQRGFDDVACTLLHEMVHIFNMMNGVQDTARRGIRHNQKFAEAGAAHGLEPYKGEDYNKAGWRVRMTEETAVYARKAFTELQQALTMYRDETKKGEVKKTKSNVLKYVCPICGASVRATKPINIKCMDCDEEMTLEE